MKLEYAIIVKSKTRLEVLIERFNTRSQAKFYIERSGGDFNDYEKEHDIFQQSLSLLQTRLTKVLKNKTIDRSFLPSYLFSPGQLIITLGQDGLVANTAKYSNGCPIVAVNPDIHRYDGILLPFDTQNFLEAVLKAISGKASGKKVYFAEAKLQDGQRLLAFNDLFIGAASHVSARYKISYHNRNEEHSSSGIIVSTQAGFTGWLSSVFNMSFGIATLYNEHLNLNKPTIAANQLMFAVREPFKSLKTQVGVTAGIINKEENLVIDSLMPSGGVIFSDGIEADFLQFNSGMKVEVGLAKEFAILVQQDK